MTRRDPGIIATSSTGAVCPSSVCSSTPSSFSGTLHTFRVPSSAAETIRPSGVYANAFTAAMWPRKVRRSGAWLSSPSGRHTHTLRASP